MLVEEVGTAYALGISGWDGKGEGFDSSEGAEYEGCGIVDGC
jgi:hypothetical protein